MDLRSHDLSIDQMQKYLKNFIEERQWEKYRTPKNLSMALAIEAAELMEIFQWIDGEDSLHIQKDEQAYQNIKDEMADILSYLLQLAQVLDIDLISSFWEKTIKNELKHKKSDQNAYTTETK